MSHSRLREATLPLCHLGEGVEEVMQTPDSEDLVSLTQDCWKLRVFPSLLRKSMEAERLWVDVLRSWWLHEYNIKWFSLPSLFLRTAKRPRCDWGSLSQNTR